MTGVHEEVTYCPPSTSSGKQKKNRSTSQPQFRSENTPAMIEADQVLLALQQLANNNNSANFHNNINRISKLPKSLTTTMPTFDGKTEKFELFEDLFQTSLKIQNQLTEDDRINYFHSLLNGDALETFKNINGPTRENLEEILAEKTVTPIPLTRTAMEKETTPQRNVTLEPMQPIDRLPGIEDRKDKISYQREPIKVIVMKLLKLQPKI